MNPFTYEVVWRYTPRDLFSISRGRVQRLPNGNTLIVSNSQGYAVEVTPAQEVVWKFVNPDVDEKGERGILSVFTRYGGRYIGFGPSTDTP